MTALDPVVLEVLWNRLLSVVNEEQVALQRTAFSTVLRESQDLACGVFDTRGNMVAQSLTGTPGHINAMATGVRHFLDVYPVTSLVPGDVLLTNDPWQTCGQINDMTVLTPTFVDGTAVALFASTCHSPDIGGRVLSAEAREVYEEGLRIPICKLVDAGEPNEMLLTLLRANVRTPDETIGDLYAQMAANDVAGRSLVEFLSEFGLDTIDPLADEIIARSERALRDAIRELPNGRYSAEGWSDGFDEPIRLCCTVTVEDEDVHVDWTGSSPQSPRGINVVLNYTHAYASFAVKAAISPDVPHNEGSFRPVHVTAPEGSILNCKDPAAVASRHIIGHFLPCVIFQALAPAMPGRLMAGGSEPLWISVWRGEDVSGELFTQTLFQVGGAGARATKDGISATGFPSGVGGVPAEVIETLAPLVLRRRELRVDSGGPGRQRGGLGQLTEMAALDVPRWTVSLMTDRTAHPGKGIGGGDDGALGAIAISGTRLATPKAVVTLPPDGVVRFEIAGGGGYGPARTRDPALVLADVVEGYVTIGAARRDYGVAILFDGPADALVRTAAMYRIDADETARLRAAT